MCIRIRVRTGVVNSTSSLSVIQKRHPGLGKKEGAEHMEHS